MESLAKRMEACHNDTEKRKVETCCFQVYEKFSVEEKLHSHIIIEEELQSMNQSQNRFAVKIKCFLKLNEFIWA